MSTYEFGWYRRLFKSCPIFMGQDFVYFQEDFIMNFNGIDFDTYFKNYPDENGYFGYTFRELWEMFNQNKLIFIFRKDSAESSVPDATDYKTRLFMVFRMEYTGGINYYLTLLACSEDSQAIMSPCIGSADTSPCIH